MAPGEILSLFGLPLGWDGAPESARVLFDGIPGEVLYSSAAQVNVVPPAEIAGRAATSIEVEWKGAKSAPRGVPVAADAPAVFTADASGRGQAAALNQDGTANSPANPAGRGTIIELYATGVNSTPAAAIGGKAAAVQQHQAARGITRLSLMAPPDAAVDAAVPVVVTAGEAGSQAGVTLAVK